MFKHHGLRPSGDLQNSCIGGEIAFSSFTVCLGQLHGSSEGDTLHQNLSSASQKPDKNADSRRSSWPATWGESLRICNHAIRESLHILKAPDGCITCSKRRNFQGLISPLLLGLDDKQQVPCMKYCRSEGDSSLSQKQAAQQKQTACRCG